MLKARRFAHRAKAQPISAERRAFHVEAERSERVDVTIANAAPIAKLDAEFERRLRLADEIVLVDPEHAVEEADVGERGFADADDAHFLGFDQGDGAVAVAQEAVECGGRHPAGRSSANDRNAFDAIQRLNSNAVRGAEARSREDYREALGGSQRGGLVAQPWRTRAFSSPALSKINTLYWR